MTDSEIVGKVAEYCQRNRISVQITIDAMRPPIFDCRHRDDAVIIHNLIAAWGERSDFEPTTPFYARVVL